MKWPVTFAFPIIAVLLFLPPACISAEVYIWSDESGNIIVSSEKSPTHTTEFQTIEQSDSIDRTQSATTRESDISSQCDDIPALILEKIKRTARNKWPDNDSTQDAVFHRQAQACRYVLNACYLNFPVPGYDRIIRDIKMRWPDDYEQQAAYIKKQYQSYQAVLLNENYGLSPDEIRKIKYIVEAKWPLNYVRQEQFLIREAEYRIVQIKAEMPEDRISGLRTYKIGGPNIE